MLGPDRTTELREIMPIFLIHESKRHLWLIGAIAGLLSILLPQQVFALQVSPPVGVQEIGKRLHLRSSLSGIQDGAESQLRSTCLRARIKSIETSPSIGQSGNSGGVLVDFQPTVRQGGLLEFKSVEPVNDALVELELTSECPLVVFTSRWTLIMNATASPKVAPVAAQSARVAQESNSFDFRNSSLLLASRRAPTPVAQYDTKPVRSEPKVVPEPGKGAKVSPPVNEVSSPPAEKEAVEEPLRLASLPPDVLTSGLIESGPIPNALENMDQRESEGLAGFGGLISMEQWALIVSSTLLGLLALVYLLKVRPKRSRLAFAAPRRDPVADGPIVSGNEFRENSFHRDEPKQEVPGYATNRMLESLIASDDANYEDLFEAGSAANQSDLLDSSNKSSLKISLDLINRADIRTWNLPAAYQGLVEQRNKSLELHGTPEALLLRCHVGLVELAFQDARQGHTTQAQATLDLLGLVLGEHVYDVHSSPTLCVPDIVKSHVRAKMCEITGSDKRQLLRENLINLNAQVAVPGLCFHTDAWREFLSDEGAMN